MDAAYKSERKFPAYTTAQLEASLAGKVESRALAAAIEAEIARRLSGQSKAFVVPQI